METTGNRREARLRPPGFVALLWLSAAMLACGVVVHVLFVPAGAVADAPFVVPWWTLAAAFVVFEFAVVIVKVQRDPHTVSLSDVPLVLGLMLATPGALILARAVGTAVGLGVRRHPWHKTLFNLSMHYLQTVAAIALLRAVLGGSSSATLRAWVTVLVVHVLGTTMSAGLIAAAIRASDRRRRPREIIRSLAAGFAISVAGGLVTVLFLIALWSTPWSMLFVALVTGVLYAGLRGFGSLSDRHAELASVHAFSTAVGMQASETTLSEETLRHLAETLEVGAVEIAAHHMTDDGRRWFYARLDADGFTTRVHGEQALLTLIDLLAESGDVDLSELPPAAEVAMVDRGFAEGLVKGFRPNGLAGFIAVGRRRATGRSYVAARPLLVTLTGPMIANLERVALIERLQSEIAIKEHQRVHDALTGLPNRTGFVEALEEALEGKERFAVAVIDLDRFQEVNDVFGPERGDLVLLEVAQRLREGIRRDDVLARLGGDEFGVLFRSVRSGEATLALARRIGDAFLSPFGFDGASFSMSASTGISLFPDHGGDADTLMRRADMARSIAKETRGAVELFDLEQDVAAERRLMLANDLRPAIDSGGLRVAYQPKLELASGRTLGFEALARWEHPKLGRISPVEFVALAQHAGVIGPLTFSVLEQALGEAVHWRRHDPGLSVSVNVSAGVLAGEDFADRVRDALDRHGLPASALILEITESQNLVSDRRTRDSVLRLAAAGIMLSIDDFGTGYSALSYLQNLPVGEVKLDRSFVTPMAQHPGDRAIVEGTVKLLHSVGLRVVAEGIETVDVWDLLADLGCYAGQGFLMAKPLPPEEAAAWAAEPAWTRESAVR